MALISKGQKAHKGNNCASIAIEFKPRHVPRWNSKEWLRTATPEEKAAALEARRFLGVEKAVRL